MGMFDYLRCKMPLPLAVQDPELAEMQFQTKSFDTCAMDNFEIREDGSLWREEYDLRVEETSESLFGFYFHRDNPRWVPCPYSGEIRFGEFREVKPSGRPLQEGEMAPSPHSRVYEEVEFLAFVLNGQVQLLHLVTATGKWAQETSESSNPALRKRQQPGG